MKEKGTSPNCLSVMTILTVVCALAGAIVLILYSSKLSDFQNLGEVKEKGGNGPLLLKHDAGPCYPVDPVRYVFVIPSQMGDRPISEWLKTSCSCTTAIFREATDQERARIEVEVDGRAAGISGPYEQTATAKFHGIDKPLTMKITGVFLEDTPTDLELGIIPFNRKGEVVFNVRGESMGPQHLINFESSDSRIEVLEVPLLENYPEHFVCCKVVIDNQSVEGGRVFSAVKLTTGNKQGSSIKEHRVSIKADLSPALSVNPESISLGVKSEDSFFSQQVTIKNNTGTGRSIKINLISYEPDYLVVEQIPTKMKETSVAYKVSGKLPKGEIQGRLVFSTGFPSINQIVVPVFGIGE